MEDQNSIIKLLVDRISTRLDVLDGQLKGYQPILERVGSQSDNTLNELHNIKNDLNNISKLLDTTTGDFYERTTELLNISHNIQKFYDLYKEAIQNNYDNIKTLKEEMCDKDGLKDKILAIHDNIQPISKFMSWIGKPVGFLIFIVGLIIASITITNFFNSITEHWNQAHKNHQQTTMQQQK